MLNPFHWQLGWGLVLGAFVTGAIIGLSFHRADFAGGYASLRRRMMRLGHIALAALGMLNLLVALGPHQTGAVTISLAVGSLAMPAVCFLTAWREGSRHLFFIPVAALVSAVILILFRGVSP